MKRSLWAVLFCSSVLLMTAPVAYCTSVPDTGASGEISCNPRSYTDLGNGIIQDDVTGLMWQKNSAPETYTFVQARIYADNLSLGGYIDWRLPTVFELSMLVDPTLQNPSPAIDTGFFLDTRSDNYWSSTVSKRVALKVWAVDFSSGYVSYKGRRNTFYVRAVRGTTTGSSLVDNGDGSITDQSTGLMWQKETPVSTYTWKQARDYCEGLILSGYSDWRLPTRNELQTLVDYRSIWPALRMSITPRIADSYFPRTAWAPYWTSTPTAVSDLVAWYVDFLNGSVYFINTYNYYNVRAVRTVECGQ